MATPKEVDLAASSIHAELWHGELCYELSEMEQERTFPMSGRRAAPPCSSGWRKISSQSSQRLRNKGSTA